MRRQDPRLDPTAPRWLTISVRQIIKKTPNGHRYMTEYPEVRISGRWLEKCGFTKGKKYLVSSPKPGVLLMTLME